MSVNGAVLKRSRTNNVRVITITAMLSSIASVLMFLDFPLPFFPAFIKFDFSELPPLIGAFMLGPWVGVAIELIKNLIHLTRTSTAGVGELANFLIGCAFVVPAGIIYKHNKTRTGAFIAMLAGIVCMTLIGVAANYFILIPFYSALIPIDKIIAMAAKVIPFIDSVEDVVFFSILPFNLFKGIIISLVAFLTYKKLSVIISREG